MSPRGMRPLPLQICCMWHFVSFVRRRRRLKSVKCEIYVRRQADKLTDAVVDTKSVVRIHGARATAPLRSCHTAAPRLCPTRIGSLRN